MTNEEENKIRINDELQKECDLDHYHVVSLNTQVPSNFSAKVKDKQEFKNIQYYLNEFLGLDYEFEIVGYYREIREYEAVFYTGPKPINLLNKIKETYG